MANKKQTIDKYEIIEEIGSGGFGTVYKAHDPGLDRFVALKILQPRHLGDLDTLERFRQEARQSARLKHPHIVTVYEVGESQGQFYIAMELLQGQPLSQVIDQEGSITPQRAAEVISQVGEALDYAHTQGVIHRDVKPSNIILDENDRATLTDFGIVKVLSEDSFITTTGAAAGTPLYMAPEQITGETVDGRSDIYALGVVAYHLLSGQVPFSGSTPFAIQKGHVDQSPPDPREHNPALGEYVTNVLLKSLTKQPGERYQSGAALATALAEAVQQDQEAYWLDLYKTAQNLAEQRKFSEALEKWGILQKARPDFKDIDQRIAFIRQQLDLDLSYVQVAETLDKAHIDAAEILQKDASYPDQSQVFERLGLGKKGVENTESNTEPALNKQSMPLMIAIITLLALATAFVYILSTPDASVLTRNNVYFYPVEIDPYMAGLIVGIALVFWFLDLASLILRNKRIVDSNDFPVHFLVGLGTILALATAFAYIVSSPSPDVLRFNKIYFYPVSISPYLAGGFIGIILIGWFIKLVALVIRYLKSKDN